MNGLIVILGSMGKIEADIALKSRLFEFRPVRDRGKFTLPLIFLYR